MHSELRTAAGKKFSERREKTPEPNDANWMEEQRSPEDTN